MNASLLAPARGRCAHSSSSRQQLRHATNTAAPALAPQPWSMHQGAQSILPARPRTLTLQSSSSTRSVLRPSRLVAALAAYSDTDHSAPQRVFMFDPNNPDSVQEMTVQPHEDIAAAEELLLAAEEEAQALMAQSSGSNGGASAGGASTSGRGANGQRTPIPLRAVSPMPSRGTPMGQRLASPLPARAQVQAALATANSGSNSSALSAKSTEMQKQLVAQLEKEQTQVAHLAQYESMYREWRIKAERLESDLNMMQRLVAEKDAELAHGYRLLEASAAERSRLRHSFQAAQEQAKALQHQLAEAQLLADGKGPAGLLGAAGSTGKPSGGASSSSSTVVPDNVQAMIEELSSLARGLAVEMKDEVNIISRASPVRSG